MEKAIIRKDQLNNFLFAKEQLSNSEIYFKEIAKDTETITQHFQQSGGIAEMVKGFSFSPYSILSVLWSIKELKEQQVKEDEVILNVNDFKAFNNNITKLETLSVITLTNLPDTVEGAKKLFNRVSKELSKINKSLPTFSHTNTKGLPELLPQKALKAGDIDVYKTVWKLGEIDEFINCELCFMTMLDPEKIDRLTFSNITEKLHHIIYRYTRLQDELAELLEPLGIGRKRADWIEIEKEA